MITLELTEFVKEQSSEDIIKLLHEIEEDCYKIINSKNKNFKQGLYQFSMIVSLFNPKYNKLKCRLVKINSKNEKHLKTDYVARRDNEIPYLKRWFPKNAPVRALKAHHLDVIMYNKEQLNKEGSPIKSDWGIVCINIELEKQSPISPTTMINNQMGIEFGGNGQKINISDYLKSVDFWKHHALLEK